MASTNWGMVGAAALEGLGSYFGGKSQADAATDAAKIQARSIANSQKSSQAFQEKMLGEATGYMNPYSEMGLGALGEMQGFNQTGGIGGDILGQMSGMAKGGLNMDYQSDPAYQWRLQQAEEQAQRQMASMGGLDSRLAYDVVGDRGMALSGEEADKQYLRGVDDYNRQYGDLTNQYNYQYGGLMDRMNTGYNANQSLAGMATGVGQNVGNQIMTSGMTSAGNTASLSAQAGQAMGGAYAGMGGSLGDMMNTYALREPIADIMSSFGQNKPATTYGSSGWGTLNQPQQQPQQNLGTYNPSNWYNQ